MPKSISICSDSGARSTVTLLMSKVSPPFKLSEEVSEIPIFAFSGHSKSFGTVMAADDFRHCDISVFFLKTVIRELNSAL